MSEKVNMLHAYKWVCPGCKSIHYADSVVAEFSAEERADAAEDGIDARTGEWETCPGDVTCEDCGNEYETEHGELA